MKKFFSTQYSEGAFNVAILALRLCFGLILCFYYGLDKLQNFGHLQYVFPDPFHIGHRIALSLVIFAELLCSLLLAIGLFTRFAALVACFSMCVAEFWAHHGQVAHMNGILHEQAWLYLTAFFAILLLGPGRISVDGAMGK